jgi:copper transport protein
MRRLAPPLRRPSLRRLVVALALVALAIPAAAWAHATLESESPGFQQELQVSPHLVTLHFDQFTLFPFVEVYNSAGRTFAGKAASHGLEVSAPVRTLPTGDYTVRWHVLSADGHVVSGVWTFGVRERALPPTQAYGASGPTRTEHVVRWLYFCSFALLIGTLAFRLICLRGLEVPAATARRLVALSFVGVIGSIEVGILAFCLRCEDVLQLPFSTYLYGDLTPIADGTRFGIAFIWMTLGFALVSALIYLAWLLERRLFLLAALLVSCGLLSGLSVSGHDGVDPGSSWTTEIADWVHITAASMWIGGLVALAFALWPTAPALRRQVFVRFSRLATGLVSLVLAAGIYLALVRVPHLRDLWTTGYGEVLLVKISLVAVAVAWGGVHHFLVRPRLPAANEGLMSRLGMSIAGETMIGIAVLLVAAVLVDSNPPPRPFIAPGAQAAARR